MNDASPDDPSKRLLQTTADERIGASALTAADVRWIETLTRTRRTFAAFHEMSPLEGSEPPEGWDGSPTPLASRHLSAPWPDPKGRYRVVLVTARATREHAVRAARRFTIGEQEAYRVIVELEADSLDVIDAHNFWALSNRALERKDARAWTLLRAIRDRHAPQAIWIHNTLHGGDALVIFIEAIGTTMRVRSETVCAIDRYANARPVPVDASPTNDHKPATPAARSCAAAFPLALLCAVIAHPIFALAEHPLHVEIAMPALVPVLVAVLVGVRLARALAPRFQRARRIIAHILELPESHAEQIEAIEELQRKPRPP